MRNFFKGSLVLGMLAGWWLSGCSGSGQLGTAKVYTIYRTKVKVAPPSGWSERLEASPEVKGQNAVLAFEPPGGGGHIAVTVSYDMPQTQEFMNQLGSGIQARQGKILKQWYEHKLNEPDSKNAYFMEYELQDAGVRNPHQKGMQVQIFTQSKTLYSLMFSASPKVYQENKATFLDLVKSFELAQ